MIKYTYKSTIAILSIFGLLAILTTYTHNIYIIISALIAYALILVIIDISTEKQRERENGVPLSAYNELIDECNKKDIEIAELKRDFSNQVMATNRCEIENRNWLECDVKNHVKIHNTEIVLYWLYKLLDDIDTTSDIYKDDLKGRIQRIDELQQERHKCVDENVVKDLYNRYYKQEDDILVEEFPFTEPINQCECGDSMRETKCYWICDNCKKRVRKLNKAT